MKASQASSAAPGTSGRLENQTVVTGAPDEFALSMRARSSPASFGLVRSPRISAHGISPTTTLTLSAFFRHCRQEQKRFSAPAQPQPFGGSI